MRHAILAVSILAAWAHSAAAFHLPLSGGVPVLRGAWARSQLGGAAARVRNGRLGGLRMVAPVDKNVKLSREERLAMGESANRYNKARPPPRLRAGLAAPRRAKLAADPYPCVRRPAGACEEDEELQYYCAHRPREVDARGPSLAGDADGVAARPAGAVP